MVGLAVQAVAKLLTPPLHFGVGSNPALKIICVIHNQLLSLSVTLF